MPGSFPGQYSWVIVMGLGCPPYHSTIYIYIYEDISGSPLRAEQRWSGAMYVFMRCATQVVQRGFASDRGGAIRGNFGGERRFVPEG